jgi:hypothetical protein
LKTVGARTITPRPWNPLGLDNYVRLGRPRPDLPNRFLAPDEEKALLRLLEAAIAAAAGNQLRHGANSPVQA